MNLYQGRPSESEIPAFYQNYVRGVKGDKIEFILSEGKKETLAFLQVLPKDKWDYRYAPEKWTIKELLLHIIDCERIFATRLLRVSRGDATPMPGFDENIYTENCNANNRTSVSLIDEYEAVREATLQLVKNLTPEMWRCIGNANDVSFTALGLAYIMAGHEAHHLRIVEERYL